MTDFENMSPQPVSNGSISNPFSSPDSCGFNSSSFQSVFLHRAKSLHSVALGGDTQGAEGSGCPSKCPGNRPIVRLDPRTGVPRVCCEIKTAKKAAEKIANAKTKKSTDVLTKLDKKQIALPRQTNYLDAVGKAPLDLKIQKLSTALARRFVNPQAVFNVVNALNQQRLAAQQHEDAVGLIPRRFGRAPVLLQKRITEAESTPSVYIILANSKDLRSFGDILQKSSARSKRRNEVGTAQRLLSGKRGLLPSFFKKWNAPRYSSFGKRGFVDASGVGPAVVVGELADALDYDPFDLSAHRFG